jgi:hypothetical protein
LTTPPIGGEPDLDTPPDGVARPRPGLGAGTRIAIVVSVLAAFVLGAGVAGVAGTIAHAVRGMEVGDCLRITSEDPANGEFQRIKCSAPTAAFRVETKEPTPTSCPGEDYTRFRYEEGTSSNSQQFMLCLTLNVVTGDCLNSLDDETKLAKVVCGSADSRVLVSVHEGSTASACDSADVSLHYVGPPERTVCLHNPGESI